MNVVDIIQAVAKNVGIEPPSAALSSTDPDCVKLVQFSNEAGQEIARRVDWSALRFVHQIAGTGANADFALPDHFSRLTAGMSVSCGGMSVRGGVSPDEWFSLVASEGQPRYFRLLGRKVSFYPFPAAGTPVAVQFQSKNWVEGRDTWGSDGDIPLIPAELIQQGTVYRFKRHIGADFQDYMAEFEATLADCARFDDGARLP